MPGNCSTITSTNPNDDVIEALCAANDVPCFRGDENDLLDRHYQAAVAEQADFILKIPSDSPLTDFRVINMMVNFWRDNPEGVDFVTNIRNCGAASNTPVGNRIKNRDSNFLKLIFLMLPT